MKTKAAILYELNSPLQLEEIDIPKLKKGQVLVKIKASGICRTQLNEIKGFKGEDKYLPHLLGHEGSGIVIETGEGVTKIKVGDRVVLTWIKGKGLEGGPVKYRKNNLIINSGSIATFSEYAVISENRLVKIPDKVNFVSAALLGCSVTTGTGIVIHHFNTGKGDSLAVFGTGGIGGGVILGAGLMKFKKIIGIDVSDIALNFAGKIGATDCVKFNESSVVADLRKIVDTGVDYVVEASGNKIAMERAIESVKDNGMVIIAGNAKNNERICINPFDLIKGKKIIGTWGGESEPDKDIPYYANMFIRNKLKLDKLIGKLFKFEDINNALKLLEDGKSSGRLVIEF